MKTLWSNLLLVCFVVSGHLLCAQNIFDYEHSLSYSCHLINEGRHNEADVELNRMHRTFEGKDTILFLLIQNAGAYNPAKACSLAAAGITPATPAYIYRLAIRIAFSFDSISLAERLVHLAPFPPEQKNALLFHTRLYFLDTAQARLHLEKVNLQHDSFCRQLPVLYERAAHLPHKRKGRAVLLSVFVPGSGKAYAKQAADGLLAFLTTGVFSYQAYSGFSQKGISSIYGWIYGTAAVAFYGGSIYGSSRAVSRYNTITKTRFRDELKSSFNCYIP